MHSFTNNLHAGSFAFRIDCPLLLLQKPSVKPFVDGAVQYAPKLAIGLHSSPETVTVTEVGVVDVQLPAGRVVETVYVPTGTLKL